MLFNANKFLNFYGFAPTVLTRTKGKALPTLNKRVDSLAGATRAESPLGKSIVFDLTLGTFTFEIPPVITVNLKKNVVTTKIAGADLPPAVELIGSDVYTVKIEGYLENNTTHTVSSKPGLLRSASNAVNLVQSSGEIKVNDNQFPAEKLESLVKLFELKESLEVKSELLDLFGISRIVLTEMPEVTYYPTAFTYSFTAIADKPFELEILE